MRKTMLSVVAALAIVSCAYAQPSQPPFPQSAFDELLRRSKDVPNLSDANSGWRKIHELERLFVEHQDRLLVAKGSQAYYVNEKKHMMAFLYSKTDTDGKSEEFGMLYGTNDIIRGAIKVNGKWYVSKEPYLDNGKENLKGWLNEEVIYDEHEAAKPVKVKFVLETVDGVKEVIVDLQ